MQKDIEAEWKLVVTTRSRLAHRKRVSAQRRAFRGIWWVLIVKIALLIIYLEEVGKRFLAGCKSRPRHKLWILSSREYGIALIDVVPI